MGRSKNKKSKTQLEMIEEELMAEDRITEADIAKNEGQGKERKRNQKDSDDAKIGGKKSDKKKKMKKGQTWLIYKKFFAYTLKRWRWGSCCLLVTFIAAFFQSIYPFKLGQLLDLIANQTDGNIDPDEDSTVFKSTLKEEMLIIGGLTLLIGIFTFVRHVVLQLFQQQLAVDLKCEIYNIFIQNDINFFELHQSNALVSRLSNDVNQAKSAISNNLTMLLRHIVLCIGSLLVLMGMSWKCTLIILSILPFYSYVTLVYKRKAKQLIKKRQDIQAKISVHVGQKFAGISVIKSYNTEEKQMQKYQDLNYSVYELNKQRTYYQGIHSTCSNFLPSFASLLVLLFASVKLLEGDPELTAGELTSFILYCTSLANSAASISNSYTNMINGTSAIQRVFEMMNYKKLIEEDQGEKVDIDGNINFQKVNFTYPAASKTEDEKKVESLKEKQKQKGKQKDDDRNTDTNSSVISDSDSQCSSPSRKSSLESSEIKAKLFHEISFEIKKGQYIGFVGQSGSGKSTILKLIQHFYKIQDGSIYFGGQICAPQPAEEQLTQSYSNQNPPPLPNPQSLNLSQQIMQPKSLIHNSNNMNIKYLRRQIGVVNQEATLFNGTIQENITYGNDEYTQQQLYEVARKSGCIEFILNRNLFPNGFATNVGQRGNKLSGGQKQRISIARALLKKPKILLFDEATSALDSHSQNLIKDTIQEISKSQQLTIIVIAHRLSTVVHCDRLFVMKQGEIMESGSHRELIRRRGYYYELIQKQLHEREDEGLQVDILEVQSPISIKRSRKEDAGQSIGKQFSQER